MCIARLNSHSVRALGRTLPVTLFSALVQGPFSEQSSAALCSGCSARGTGCKGAAPSAEDDPAPVGGRTPFVHARCPLACEVKPRVMVSGARGLLDSCFSLAIAMMIVGGTGLGDETQRVRH